MHFERARAFAFLIRRVVLSERGATAIEYALIASLISVAILFGVMAVGQQLSGIFGNVASNLQ